MSGSVSLTLSVPLPLSLSLAFCFCRCCSFSFFSRTPYSSSTLSHFLCLTHCLFLCRSVFLLSLCLLPSHYLPLPLSPSHFYLMYVYVFIYIALYFLSSLIVRLLQTLLQFFLSFSSLFRLSHPLTPTY